MIEVQLPASVAARRNTLGGTSAISACVAPAFSRILEGLPSDRFAMMAAALPLIGVFSW